MAPSRPLPHSPEFTDAEEYVDSLLDFVGNDNLLKVLCGGVHILDFFTAEPSLYSQVLPQSWRDFFRAHDIMRLLDLFMREDLTQFNSASAEWNQGPAPPMDLIQFLQNVRKHLLQREPSANQCSRNRAMKPTQKLARHVVVGMTVKKVHEVGLFAHYVHNLTQDVAESTGSQVSHLVDFGSGQNYLGRALASEPYNHRIVAIESKSHNAERAKEFDFRAKLTVKPLTMRNKKAFKLGLEQPPAAPLMTPPPEPVSSDVSKQATASLHANADGSIELPVSGHGRVQYIEHRIQDGNLSSVIAQIPSTSFSQNLMVISLHSCGNLVHHGLRSLTLNPNVRAVAMVGCCYNLVTERLGPATYKLPELRPTTHSHPRLHAEGEANDPDGFPMSARLCNSHMTADGQKGVRLNITSRMMAVQAPQNWGEKDSEQFFRRHFYRALLQRVFLDRGIVAAPTKDCVGGGMAMTNDVQGGALSPKGHSSGGTPIIIGSLRKHCYENFVSYVRGALAKLVADPDRERAAVFERGMAGMTDAEIGAYEERFQERRKDLSVCWSLMAFSAGVIEATIVVDRWLWLREQDDVVERAWVEPVFDYALSPRNLVVVGIKKRR